MDEQEFRALVKRLLTVAETIEKLPSEVRSQAFTLLSPFISGKGVRGETKAKSKPTEQDEEEPENGEDREQFFGRFDHDKPSDNVRLIAAWWYKEHGAQPFSSDGLRDLAEDVGLTIPARADMTLLTARHKGKLLFQRAGREQWKPTVHGEKYLKDTYSVKKGRKPVAASVDS